MAISSGLAVVRRSANSDDNDLRSGMPDLGYLFEAGPEMVIRGPRSESDGRSSQLDFALQGRAVFSYEQDAGFGYEGLVFEPVLRYQMQGLFGEGSRLRASLGPIFATEDLHDYFYEVAPGFATATRPAFDATGGGALASQLLSCMEAAANRDATTYSRYGSNVYKRVYIYGSLDTSPTTLIRTYGLSWDLGGWLLTPFLVKIGILWQTGTITPSQEHFVSNLIRQKIIVALDGQVVGEICLAE